MKGIVFTEFLDFVEETVGYQVVDRILTEAAPRSGGAYTAVGHYDFKELADLVGALARALDKPAPDLIRAFGRHLFGRFSKLYPQFFDDATGALDFLQGVENRIHLEVRKLYPDARPPSIEAVRKGEHSLELTYRSCRPLGQLCLGLIEGCGSHFGEELDLQTSAIAGGLRITVRRLDRELAA